MSLNFFKTSSQKTDATLQFKSVLDSLNKKSVDTSVLDIDQFIQQENIHLGQHQEFYKSTNNKEHAPPKSISKEDNISTQDTRILVNSLIELSNMMPDMKSTAVEYHEKVKESLLKQNKDTVTKVDSIKPTL